MGGRPSMPGGEVRFPIGRRELEWSSICIVAASGQIVREAKVRSEREALVGFFAASGLRFVPIGLEAFLGARLTVPITAAEAAILMSLLKVARTRTGELNIDDFTDGAGYLAIAGEIAVAEAAAK